MRKKIFVRAGVLDFVLWVFAFLGVGIFCRREQTFSHKIGRGADLWNLGPFGVTEEVRPLPLPLLKI